MDGAPCVSATHLAQFVAAGRRHPAPETRRRWLQLSRGIAAVAGGGYGMPSSDRGKERAMSGECDSDNGRGV